MKILKILLVSGLIATAAAGAAAYVFLKAEYDAFVSQAPEPPPGKEVIITIAKGTGPTALAQQLYASGLTTNATYFALYLRKVRKQAAAIKAGEYRMSSAMKPGEIIDMLVAGKTLTYKITVAEGLNLREIAPLFAAHNLVKPSEFLALAQSAEFAQSLGIPAANLEGYLYPDTYTLDRSITAAKLLARMVHRFRETFTAAYESRAKELGFTVHQAVTLASIVEKETGAPHERPLIAQVFHNRLKKKMRLETDPTVIYAKMLAEGTFDGNITRADLLRDHPYNTYKRPGLPPGPIASPGGEALKAALYPQATDALFFVSRNDGTHVFCPTFECHTAAVQKWQVQYFKKSAP